MTRLVSISRPHSVFLGKIKEAFDRNGDLQNLLLDSFFSNAVQECQVNMQRRWQRLSNKQVLDPSCGDKGHRRRHSCASVDG